MDNKTTTIRFSIGTKAFAQAILEPTTAKEFGLRGYGKNWMHLTDVYVHPFIRGRGYARIIMEAICRHADRHQLNLVLSVLPHGKGGLKESALETFYGEFGFECYENPQSTFHGQYMKRKYNG